MLPIGDDAPIAATPLMNFLLILANVLVFVGEVYLALNGQQDYLRNFAVVPDRLLDNPDAFEIATIFTAMFMHGGWAHLLGNMWALWIFGDNVESAMGRFRYLWFYLLCGVIATVAQVLIQPDSNIPSLGASGAIAGIMGAFLVLFPKAHVRVWFGLWFIFALPAWFVIGEWFFIQVLSGSFSLSATSHVEGIAWFAHIGGFLGGACLVRLFQTPTEPFTSVPEKQYERFP